MATLLSRRGAALSALCTLAVSTHASAQVPRIVMSLSDDGAIASGTVDDEELVLVATDGSTRKLLSDQSLAFYLGDVDGDGRLDEPNDIDALDIHAVGPGTPVIAGYFLSLVSDQAGILDGDIFRFDPNAPNGIDVEFSEAFLIAAMQANDGNIDVDGLAIAADGALYFSLAEDESIGPNGTVVQDEAVFVLPAGSTNAPVLYDAATMEQMVQNALQSTVAIGDVKSIELLGAELLFTVQSPTADDATVFSTVGGGSIYQGLVEASMGFQGQVECDALALLEGDAIPALELDFNVTNEGLPVVASLAGLAPGMPFVMLMSGGALPGGSGLVAGGFGTLAIDPLDPIYLVAVQNILLLAGGAGPLGNGSIQGVAPGTGGVPFDLALQALDGHGRLSAPIMLELNQ